MPDHHTLNIVHPTDFSQQSATAFLHALKLAVVSRASLHLLHVQPRDADTARHMWEKFPKVRETLEQWGLLPPASPREAVVQRLGMDVFKYDLHDDDVAAAICGYARKHDANFLVLGTHGRDGLSAWLKGSVASTVAAELRIPALFVAAGVKGFVDPATGGARLDRVLMPVDHRPDPGPAYRFTRALLKPFGRDGSIIDLLHAGDAPPSVIAGDPPGEAAVRLASGGVEAAILAGAKGADLIAMATENRHGFLDALRGSTTERIVHQARAPVLAIPAR